jgi:hypothetical protein
LTRSSHSIPLIAVVALLSACASPRSRPVSATAVCIEDERHLGPPSQLSVTTGPVASDVEGVVVLRPTGAPLAGAKVWLDTTANEPTESAANGRFVFREVRPGRHAIVMRRIGVRGLRDSIDVPVAGQLRIEAQPVPNDGGCDSFGEVTVAKP